MKFIDLARQMESFFLQKRFLLSSSKPELLLKEENLDLRHEIARKDELIKKNYQKIIKWKELLADSAPVARPGIPPNQMPPGAGQGSMVMAQQAGPSQMVPGSSVMHPQQMMQQQQMMQPNNAGGMFMGPRPGFPPQGTMGVPNQNMGVNPLAFLEKTTNNIMTGDPSVVR